ncbi:hypothetical protein FPV21_03480 [Carnobacterium sp. PL12RED10]|uniref:hypothetical protein n=1 Tax=Carnobacterium sp. PL12RED10 TaxID=2592351 RepID=UPI0011EC5F09|nr:hypothetical protein [Carnobacterium sp. PL12RED10]KAF3301358.1 hypothetical protein FPV21_03480 [Carnobacterium sp. PL12RED10]
MIVYISFVISIIALGVSIYNVFYQRKKDNNLLKPQLFLESQNKQTLDYIGIDLDIGSYEKLQEYDVLLKFINTTQVRIIDLSVSIDVRKNDTFYFLLSKALEEKENNFDIEKDMFGNDIYGWDKVLGLQETTKEKISVLDGGDSFELKLPNIFAALLLGAMYLNRNGFKESNFTIDFDIKILYNHDFVNKDKYVCVDKTVSVNITYERAIQGPWVIYDSIIFDKL